MQKTIYSNLNLDLLLHRDQHINPIRGITIDSNFMTSELLDEMIPSIYMLATIFENLFILQMDALVKHHVDMDPDSI